MGRFGRFFGASEPKEGPDRLAEAFERMAAALEKASGGISGNVYRSRALGGGDSAPEQVFYTDEAALAVEEARKLIYELRTGIALSPLEETPGPVDPKTGLPWGETRPEGEPGGAGELREGSDEGEAPPATD